MDLPKVLAELRAAGVTRGKYTEDGQGGASLEVDWGQPAVPVTPLGLVDATGKPVDLDEGMGVLERDPLAEEGDDEPAAPDPILTRNFKKAPPDAAS